MSKKRLKTIRVDKDVWNNVERIMPNARNPERSRKLYENSLFNIENVLRNKLGGTNAAKTKTQPRKKRKSY